MKKSFRKILSAILVLILVVVLLCGCGPQVGEEPGGAVINNDPVPELLVPPATFAEFLSREDTSYYGEGYVPPARGRVQPLYHYTDELDLFDFKVLRACYMMHGVLALLRDEENNQDLLQYVNMDGTGRITAATMEVSSVYSNRAIQFGRYTALVGLHNFGAESIYDYGDSWGHRYIYYYVPSNEVMEVVVRIPKYRMYGIASLTNTDLIWFIETDEHEEWRRIHGIGDGGGLDDVLLSDNTFKDLNPTAAQSVPPALEYYAYSLLTDKNYFLGYSTPFMDVFDTGMFDPWLETWLEEYRVQRDKDLAAMG